MSLRDIIFGRPLASSEEAKEELSVITGVPVLGLDALASTGYGPEAALTILLPLGAFGLRYFPFIIVVVVVQLTMLYLSYQQTAAAYPNGGGAYIVAHDNLGRRPAVWAAVALLVDYLLNVTVGIAAGVGAIVSAIPTLHPHTLTLCLIILITLMFVNLRGVRESGMAFVIPVFIFIACIGGAIVIGLVRALQSGGHPQAISPLPPIPHASATLSTWLLMGAFANGCTAMTGIEAVSNGVPLFREPKVHNAQLTLTVIVGVLGLFLLSLGYLCSAYHIGAMNEQQRGYQTILSQLIIAIAGRGAFFYIASAAIFIVLTYSAQTSFTDFPRVCRLLAQDDYLPRAFAERGRRLVFSVGIIILTTISGLILIAFGGVTQKLIPLFAVGAFTAFLFSQLGMVVHWLRRTGPGVRIKLAFNALGAVTTSIALIVIISAKFIEGAWMTIAIVPALVLLLQRINRHYKKITDEVAEPLDFQIPVLQSPAVVIPIHSWDRVAEKAMRFALLLSDDITAVNITTEGDNKEQLKQLWEEKVEKPAKSAGAVVPRLEIIDSPYRQLYQPILSFIDKIESEKPDRIIAVIIPELVEPHWYEYLLHNLRAAGLRAQLFLRRDEQVIVINAPWYLHDT